MSVFLPNAKDRILLNCLLIVQMILQTWDMANLHAYLVHLLHNLVKSIAGYIMCPLNVCLIHVFVPHNVTKGLMCTMIQKVGPKRPKSVGAAAPLPALHCFNLC